MYTAPTWEHGFQGRGTLFTTTFHDLRMISHISFCIILVFILEVILVPFDSALEVILVPFDSALGGLGGQEVNRKPM